MPSSPENPTHYNVPGTNLQLIDVLKSSSSDMGLPPWEFFLWSSVMQYALRFSHKGAPYDDLKKCRVYLDWLIECYEPHSGATGRGWDPSA